MEKVNEKIIEHTGHTFSGWMNRDVMIFLSYIAKKVIKLAGRLWTIYGNNHDNQDFV